jgi:hypothetical protein
MTTVETRRQGARAGYVAAAAVNGILLWLIHVWPGWDAVPFLTADFELVLWLVDLSLVVAIVLNLVYLVRDPRWLTAAGAVVTLVVGLAGAVRMLQVFPFDFGGSDFWPMVVRILLWVGIAGSVIGIVANVGTLVRAPGAR